MDTLHNIIAHPGSSAFAHKSKIFLKRRYAVERRICARSLSRVFDPANAIEDAAAAASFT